MKLLDAVTLTQDEPEKGFCRGQVGTIVEKLGPAVFEVEFCDLEGRAYASMALPEDHLMLLHYQAASALARADQ